MPNDSSTGPTYVDERKLLLEAELELGKLIDHWLLTLAGGALGLSIAFLKDIVGSEPPAASSLLFVSWLMLSTTVGTVLYSMRIAQRGLENFRDDLDVAFFQSGNDPGVWSKVRERQSKRPEPRCVERLNLIGMWAFLLGILSLGLFSCINLPQRTSDARKPQADRANGGKLQATDGAGRSTDTPQGAR